MTPEEEKPEPRPIKPSKPCPDFTNEQLIAIPELSLCSFADGEDVATLRDRLFSRP